MENPSFTTIDGSGSTLSPQEKQDEQFMQMTYTLIYMSFSGFVMSIIYMAFNYVYEQIRRKLTCSITISSNDDIYKIILDYLSSKGLLSSSMTQLKCQLKKKGWTWWWNRSKEENQKPEVEYLPGPGNHFFTYNGKKMWAVQSEGETLMTGWEKKPTKQELLYIMCYGTDTAPLRQLVEDAINVSQEKDTSLVNIYQVHRWGGSWEKCQQKRPRALNSVVLDSGIADNIIQDINKFLGSGEWYQSKGVPYRRGYLLYGPPGTGKTSFVQAVAGACNLNICYLNLSGGNMDDDGLNTLLNNSPLRSIILLEDIDAIFVDRTSVQGKMMERQQVTFSGLLNALDGVRSQEGRILMMTTNHREKLDPALLRPGRADVHVELNYASEKQMKGLFQKFFPDEAEEKAQEFANQLPEYKLNMAKLQGHFLKYKSDIQGAIENAKSLLDVDYQIKDMSISEWLRRLNMLQYAPKFRKESGIKRVSDLKYIGEGDLTAYGMTAMIDRKRIMGMISGDEDCKILFALQTQSQARTVLHAFLTSEADIEELLTIIGDEQITGWQLRDILDENKNFEVIKKKLRNKIIQNQLVKQGKIKDEDEKDDKKEEEEKKKKKDFPQENIEAMLKSISLTECIAKMKEAEIADPDVFFELDDATLITCLGIETEGKKFRFKEKMKEVKEKHEKLKAKKEQDDISEIVGDAFEKIQKKLSVIY
ncbi:mitochondrial chaperone bcs1 [Stylonychia lemnae]|uniref:Mitochondrial chaperone bcs1 n=1 Tax=Stylonychia lemnae TaxID=5949 RepID=A0A078AU90_STYLE|nr:mitochondrial chaperone bcs1 [Stylonychia lemnae]|eukprot:CDW85975.1 mitochondrial chaperone bcs1 [Stylonychia lemnae]